jgi:hypothetical protein
LVQCHGNKESAVAKFYIDNEIEDVVIRDEVGDEFCDADSAILEAQRGLMEIAADRIRSGRSVGEDRAIVRGEEGVVARLSIRDALWDLLAPSVTHAGRRSVIRK